MKIYVLFGNRYVFLAATLLGILLALPTLSSGFFLDDYQQRIILLTDPSANAFEFFHRGTAATEAWLQNGVLAWWTHPQTKVVFFRPIAQWLMQLDYRLWPDSLPLMHLHSVFWYGIAVLVAGLTYREIMPTRWAAGLAAVLFAVDAAHGAAVAWLPNRNAFVCVIVALLALLCYRRRQFHWQLLGCALFALSLAASESALAITGYLFAYEIFLSERRWPQHILRLLPYALIAIAWIAFWKYRGYGTAGPGFYIDPVNAPALFFSELIYRFPVYLVGQLFFPPPEIFLAAEYSGARMYALIYAVAVVALLVWLLMPLLRSSRLARFYGLGMLIAALPICGSAPVSRSLWFVGFGATGLLALFIEQFRGLMTTPARLRWSRAFAGTMLVLHLWLSPVLFIAASKTSDGIDRLMDSRRVQLPDNADQHNKVLAISALSYTGNITFPLLKDQALSLGVKPTRPPPSITQIRALVEGEGEFELRRKDADTLTVVSRTGFETLRPREYGFASGDRVVLNDVEILVRSVSIKGAPTEIEYRFNPGELKTYEIIAWEDSQFAPATLPNVGESARIQVKKGKLF